MGDPVHVAFVNAKLQREQNRHTECLKYVENEYKAQLEKSMEKATGENSDWFRVETTGKCAPEIVSFLHANGWSVNNKSDGGFFKTYWHSVDENGKLNVDVKNWQL